MNFKLIKSQHHLYLLSSICLSLFAGLRFEVGSDWDVYTNYFNSINYDINLYDGYLINPKFEIGYYALNYLVSMLKGNISTIFFISNIIFGYYLYSFTKNLPINKIYFLVIYFSYSYIILNFAQVRQLLALTFLIIGLYQYTIIKNKIIPPMIILTGVLFHSSAIIYFIIYILAFNKIFNKFWFIFASFFFTLAALVVFEINIQEILTHLIFSESAADKLKIYKDTELEHSVYLSIYSVYLFIISIIIFIKSKIIDEKYRIILNYAFWASFFSGLSIIIFPGSYVYFSRTYSVANIFIGLSISIIWWSNSNKSKFITIFYYITIIIAEIYLVRIIIINHNSYIPYKSIFN